MPRRAKTSLHPLHLLGMAAAIVVIAGAGWFILSRKSETGGGGTDLSVVDFLQNSNALSNNSYKIEGTVRGRLDEDWKSSDGRLFSVEVEDGGQVTPLPVWVPSKFNGTNIQRDQRFRFKVTVQANGVLEVTSLEKS
jgi:hypothetical protein